MLVDFRLRAASAGRAVNEHQSLRQPRVAAAKPQYDTHAPSVACHHGVALGNVTANVVNSRATCS